METHTKKAAGKASEALAHFPFPVSPRAFGIAATAQTHDGETGFTGAGSQCQNLRWWQNACQGSGITGRICPNEKWLPLLTSKLFRDQNKNGGRNALFRGWACHEYDWQITNHCNPMIRSDREKKKSSVSMVSQNYTVRCEKYFDEKG